jgi:hypothetical protein
MPTGQVLFEAVVKHSSHGSHFARDELMSCGRLCPRGTFYRKWQRVSGGQGLPFRFFAEGEEEDSDYEGETGEGYGGAEGLEVANSCAD